MRLHLKVIYEYGVLYRDYTVDTKTCYGVASGIQIVGHRVLVFGGQIGPWISGCGRVFSDLSV